MNAPVKFDAEQMLADDVELAIVSLLRDAELIGCAPAHRVRPNLHLLELAQDEIARAIGKARQ